jgi:hypothetical protein
MVIIAFGSLFEFLNTYLMRLQYFQTTQVRS